MLKDTTRLITLTPKDYTPYYNRALAYHNLGLTDVAIEDYTKVIENETRLRGSVL